MINDLGQLIGQILEPDLPELEPEVVAEELLDDRTNQLRINARRKEAKIDQVLRQPSNVPLDHMEEGVDHHPLQLGGDAADHPEIEEGEPAIRHHPQVSRVRIGVKIAIFEQLFEIGPRNQPHDRRRIDAPLSKTRQVEQLGPFDELHRQNPW